MDEGYLLNLTTGEIHDLSKKTPQCKIDEIKNFKLYNSYNEAVIEAVFANKSLNPNGCHYCLPALDTD